MPSLSRQLAQWVAGLRYEDLPPAVVDRAKGLTLQGLASVLLGSLTPGGQQAIKLITEEEAGVRNGATVMVDGTKVTRGGAAFANAEMAMAGGKWDTFRMLTHPGTSILPGAFVVSEAGFDARCARMCHPQRRCLRGALEQDRHARASLHRKSQSRRQEKDFGRRRPGLIAQIKVYADVQGLYGGRSIRP